MQEDKIKANRSWRRVTNNVDPAEAASAAGPWREPGPGRDQIVTGRVRKLTRESPARAAPGRTSPLLILWMFALVILGLLSLANLSFGLLSSARAYVGAESSWSKAQKDAVLDLQKYAVSRAPEDLRRFQAAIAVPLGDRIARLEMDKPHPDFDKARQGFIRGNVHSDDVDGMIELYRRFGWLGVMQRAIRAWDAGDRYIVQLHSAGTLLQREIESVSPSAARIQVILAEVLVINANLTPIENQFVAALGDASRTTYRWLRATMLVVTPGLLLLAVMLSLRILQQRKLAQDRTNHIAFHDGLTALPNRLMFSEQLDRALSRHRRAGTQLAVLILDLNRFKWINDSLGREVGDVLLRHVADRLRTQSRGEDALARIGGDEFAVLIESQENLRDIAACTGRLLEKLSAPYMLGKNERDLTLSVGISVFPADGETPQALLKAADMAVHRAKATGRNNYVFYSPAMNVQALEKLELESDLARALERGEFLLHYQPKVDTQTGSITGTEALLRWRHPRRGLISPADFIPLAEETGLIAPIGEWVLATACARTKTWQNQGLPKLSIAVNLSARQFEDPLLLPKLTQIIRASGLDPSSLELEITESMVMAKGNSAVEVLGRLKSIGVQIAIDDFGTGYSSLAYLKRFPIDTLKVDRSFIRDIPADSSDRNITRAIISMAHSLRLKVVAEGVETAAQLQFLRVQCCDAVQGYFLYRPLPEAEVADALELNRLQSAGRPAIPA